MQMWTRNKRALSESDCEEDLYLDDSKDCSSAGEGLNDSCTASVSTGGNMTRKRRRGIIEKRRRDRINHSLSELKRLVPSAFEKQGSAKLEKAEILQLTVDHLKMLHAKGLDTLAYDPHKFAMDYHNIGFRECAAEVARYMVSVEGMDVQDPMRMRLMSHLQCFAAQRELSNKPVVTATPSGVVPASAPTPTMNNNNSASTPSSVSTPTSAGSSANSWPFPPTPTAYSVTPSANPNPPPAPHGYHNGNHPSSGPSQQQMFDQSAGHHHLNYTAMDAQSFGQPAARYHHPAHAAAMSHHPAMSHHGGGPTMTTLQPMQPHHHQAPYPHVNHHPFPSLAAQNASYATSGNQVKPYRPWGAELGAY